MVSYMESLKFLIIPQVNLEKQYDYLEESSSLN